MSLQGLRGNFTRWFVCFRNDTIACFTIILSNTSRKIAISSSFPKKLLFTIYKKVNLTGRIYGTGMAPIRPKLFFAVHHCSSSLLKIVKTSFFLNGKSSGSYIHKNESLVIFVIGSYNNFKNNFQNLQNHRNRV